MADSPPDPRVNACTPALADIRLRGRVTAERFVEGEMRHVRAASAPMRGRPGADAPYTTELLRGESVRVFDTRDGWAWCQNQSDGYVGHVRAETLGEPLPVPTHRVTAIRTFVYPAPDMKLPPIAVLSLGSGIALGEALETRGTPFRRLEGTPHAVVAHHVAPPDAPPEPDYVAVAERFLNTPYLWGGRTGIGLDCSALVQLALMAAGIAAPRDSDMQHAQLGVAVASGVAGDLRRGDLVFWPGHVAILAAPDRIVHASGHHMMVVAEPLADALARIGRSGVEPLAVKRPMPAPGALVASAPDR